MKKNDHVEFSGTLPKELKNVKKKPIYGTIVKLIGKTKAEVKPRYKRFTVAVALVDLTEVTEEQFTVKQTNPTGQPVPVAKKPVVKKSKPKCDTPAKIKEAVKEAKAVVKEKKPAISTSKPTPVAEKLMETPQPILVPKIPVDKPVPLTGACLDDMPKKEESRGSDWDVEKPVNKTPEVKPTYNPDREEYLDDQERGNGVVIGVWALLVSAAAICAYYLFF